MSSVYLTPSLSAHRLTPELVPHLYLITAWVNHSQPVFSDFLAGRLLVDCLRQQQHRADTWAYIVMPDYFNWLVQLRRNMSLHKLVEQVLAGSNQQLCQYLGCTEFIWRSRYHQLPVTSVEVAHQTARDMVRAPVRAGYAPSVGAYPLWDAPRWLGGG